MDTEEFLTRVQKRAGLGDAAAALLAGRATISTLAEQLTDEEARYLAALLPPELARLLEDATATDREAVVPEVFFQRVSEREGVPVDQARDHARAVLGVMAETVPADEKTPEAGQSGNASQSRPPDNRLH